MLQNILVISYILGLKACFELINQWQKNRNDDQSYFFNRYENIFHKNHCKMTQIKFQIAKAIGNEEGYLKHQLETGRFN